jgi:hypothetical protein
VCGSGKCNRHRAGPSSHARQPWIGLEIPDEIDEAIEDVRSYSVKNDIVIMWFSC